MLFKFIKLIAIALFTYIFFTGCDDSVSKVGHDDHLEEFIHHVEHDHFEGTLFDTISAGADETSASTMDSLFMVYRVVFTGTSGYLKYCFTDTTSYERTLVTDKVLTVTVSINGVNVPAEDYEDLNSHNTEFIKMASVYKMKPNVTYTLYVTGATAGETISFFMALGGIEDDHEGH